MFVVCTYYLGEVSGLCCFFRVFHDTGWDVSKDTQRRRDVFKVCTPVGRMKGLH